MQKSRLLKILIWHLHFYGLIIALDTPFKCSQGQRIGRTPRGSNKCEECPEGQYQPKENDSRQCETCTICSTKSGSESQSSCTKISDTVCQCRQGFTPREEDSATCKCEVGSGKNMNVCRTCENGFYSSKIDSPCLAWTKCKQNKVRFSGNNTSDAVCDEAFDAWTPVATTPGLTEKTFFSIVHTPPSPSPEISSITRKLHPTNKTNKAVNNRDLVIGVIVGVIVGLLILTAVVIKCTKAGQEYQRPIEESGKM